MARDAERVAEEAARIRALRERRRATQPDVADAVHVSLRGYQAWEAGDTTPNGQNLKALAAYHNTTPDYLEYGRERAPVPDPFFSTRHAGAGTLGEVLSELDEQVRLLRSELATRDAEALKRIDSVHRAIRDLRPPRRR